MKYRRMPIEVESPEERGYHTVDCNLSESSVKDITWEALGFPVKNFPLCYSDHRGKPELRELIASGYGMQADDILLVNGAAAALFIVATSLLDQRSRLVVEFPNYGTNIETPLLLGCNIDYLELRMEEEFKPDLFKLQSMLKKPATLVSVTKPHNPTGTVITEAEAIELMELISKSKTVLLADETYRDLTMEKKLPLFAASYPGAISVSSLSKAYGLPGIRLGWIACRNKKLMETFLAAKEQIFICNSILDEEVALHFLLNKERFLPAIQNSTQANFRYLEKWITETNIMEWVKPAGGVVCFPKFKISPDTGLFYETLSEKYKTMVGPGHWFGMDDSYMRIGFGWPDEQEFKQGLQNLERAYAESVKK